MPAPRLRQVSVGPTKRSRNSPPDRPPRDPAGPGAAADPPFL